MLIDTPAAVIPETAVPLRERAARGSLALISRQIVSAPMNAFGLVCLSHFLLPRDFGIQALMVLLVGGLSIVIDAGTSQALVQSPHPPDVKTLMIVQFYKVAVALACGLLLILLSPEIIRLYHLDGVIKTRFVCVCALLAWLQSLRGHLAITLQRDLDWLSLSRIEIGEIFAQNIAAIGIAATYRSVWAFPIGLVCRHIFGIARLARHRVASPTTSSVQHRRSLRSILAFGLPLQIMCALSIVQNSINPIVVLAVAGTSAAGYIGWGFSVAALPTLALQALPVLLFTVTAEGRRRQDYDTALLAAGLRTAVVGAGAATIGMSAILPTLTAHLFGRQWQGALLPTTILLVGSLCMWLNALVTSQLHAFGLTRIRMRFALFEFGALWLTAGVGAWKGGAVGYALGFSSAELMLLIGLLRVAHKSTGICFDDKYLVCIIILSAALVYFVYFLAGVSTHRSVANSLLRLLTGSSLYASSLWAIGRRTCLSDFSLLKVAFSSR